ncbi:MAG: tail fiber domain-containing protein, partial [Bacteroidia bacterium]
NYQVNNNTAEIIWQDLNYPGNVNATTGNETRITFNFRNNQPGPCLPANNRETMTILANGRVGINNPMPVAGGIYNVPPVGGVANFYLEVTGGVLAEGYFAFSDKRFKSDIQTIENPMERIMKMRGTSYIFNAPSNTEGQKGTLQMGFIAQELEQVVPEAVVKCDNGVYAVNYNSLTPLLVEGIKQQQTTIQTLTDRVAELEKQLAQQTPGSSAPAGTFQGQLPVNPALGNLQQNVPNPFNQQTVINFSVAENAGVAMIAIYDLNGRQIRSEQLNQRGNGQLVINANELSPGMYIYALIVDGNAADSKRMIVTE